MVVNGVALDQTISRLPHDPHRQSSSVIVKDLIRVLQDRIHHLALEPCVADVAVGATSHERGAEHDGQVLACHPVCCRVLHNSEEVERDSTKRCVVGVREGVNYGVQRVATNRVVFMF